MLFRILEETFRKRKRRVGVAILSVLVGASLAAALLTLALDTADKVGRELRAYGANILVVPKSDMLKTGLDGRDGAALPFQIVGQERIDEAELVKLKTIFWRNNILGFAPYLSVLASVNDSSDEVVVTGTWFDNQLTIPAGTRIRSDFGGQSATEDKTVINAGVKAIAPWWKVQGEWVEDGDPEAALIGATLAERFDAKPGSRLILRSGGQTASLRIVGIVSTGSLEENQIFVNLPVAQKLAGISKGVDTVLVSALTLPKEKLAASIRDKKPEEMTPKEYELWYCSPIIEAIATQIQEVLPETEAKPIRQISEAEGSLVSKVEFMILLVTIVAMAASALGVMTTMTTTVLERRSEIGLMKAIGADNRQVALIFLAEAAAVGLIGGVLGYLGGLQLASVIADKVFGASVQPSTYVLPLTLLLAVGVALLGSALPVRSAVRVQPVILLKGN